jgi:RNA polymerase sigma-70 factor (ECF subfamily)
MPRAPGAPADWAAVLDRLVGGDRLAFLELSRLVTGFLARWRAYDFRDEWDDIVQEVILAAVEAVRGRRLRQPAAVLGYLRTATRYKFVDWLRRRRGTSLETERDGRPTELSWPLDKPGDAGEPERLDLWEAVKRLPERHRKALIAVYVEGRTYEEAAEATEIPLGSLKRYLREGLATLRDHLEPRPRGTDPLSASSPTRLGEGDLAGPEIAPAGGRK